MSSKRSSFAVLSGAVGFVAAAGAQAPAPAPPAPPEDTVFFLSNAMPIQAFGGRIDILRGEGDIPGVVVLDKPYSARSITQSTQTLADGNRITQRNEARIYRDSQGRTRREQTIGGVGPWQTAGEPVTMITINDPVADKSYVLDPVARTAREIRPFHFRLAQAEPGVDVQVDVDRVEVRRVPPGSATPAPVPAPGEAVTVVRTEVNGAEPNVRVFTRGVAIGGAARFAGTVGAHEPAEDLGEQVLEGLLVKGERLTDTIPAGAMGNERPIEIVTERWYSNDIDALVRHRFFDPRIGETTYELVNVARGDPSPELFQVPQGYEITVVAGPSIAPLAPMPPRGVPGQRVQIETRIAE
ncbi:MAG TPA: hypothetical protein VIQ99_07295 [Gammaproteobacteria bacterium]